MPPRRRLPPQSRLRGLFADGVWQCDCTPRLPAERFQVKKEGKNKGRWFYTCQKAEAERCGFFLWEDDAKPRMESAVLSNSRNEVRSTPNVRDTRHDFGAKTGSLQLGNQQIQQQQQQSGFMSPPPPQIGRGTTTATTSRTISRQPSFGDGGISFDTFAEAERDVEISPTKALPSAPMTPVKRKFGDIADTEAIGGLVTPHTGSESKRKRVMPWEDGISAEITPTTSRIKSNTSMTPEKEDDLYMSIERALVNHKSVVSTETKNSLQSICSRFTLRNQGVLKGREIARLALKAKDARILELEHRINTLEAELDMQKALVRHLKWEMQATG